MDGIALDDYIKNQKAKSRLSNPRKPNGSQPHQANPSKGKIDRPLQKTERSVPANQNSAKVWKKQLLIIEGLPLSIQNDGLKNLFSKFGELSRCNVFFDIKGDSKVC